MYFVGYFVLVLLLYVMIKKFWFVHVITFYYWSAEQEGLKVTPLDLNEFVEFVKKKQFQSKTFFIADGECEWFCIIIFMYYSCVFFVD